MKAPIRIGLLGAARITPGAIIDPARDLPDVEVTAIAARDPGRARDFAEQHNIPNVYESYAALIQAPNIDLIYNALPINHHADWSIRCAQAGKSVLCEKPFAMKLREAEAMIDAARSHSVRIIEAFHYRYHPAFVQCLDWVQAGHIGKILHIDAEFSVYIRDTGHEIRHAVETGGGAMMDLGCYPLNWILALIPDAPRSITATAKLTPAGVDETRTADLLFPNAVSAHIRTSMAAEQKLTRILRIRGERGDIHFENPLNPHITAHLSLTETIDNTQDNRPTRVAEIDPRTTYFHQLSAVSQALKTGAPLPTEGHATLRQQTLIDAVYAAAGLAHLRDPG